MGPVDEAINQPAVRTIRVKTVELHMADPNPEGEIDLRAP